MGIPKNYDDMLKSAAAAKTNTNGVPDTLFKRMPPMAICDNCGGPDMTNWIIPKQPDGSVIPWIQRVVAPLGPTPDLVQKSRPSRISKLVLSIPHVSESI